MRHSLRTHSILFLLFLTGTTFLTAQSGDIQLTRNPESFYLPTQIRIEASAVLDETVLAVWGTTYRNDNGAVRTGLVSQIIRDGVPVGEPAYIHDEDAAPSGFVRAYSYNTGFIVMWNDGRTNGRGVYARLLDRDGMPVGDAWLALEGQLVKSFSQYGSRERGGLLLWWNSHTSSSGFAWWLPADGPPESHPMYLSALPVEFFKQDNGGLLALADGSGYEVGLDGRLGRKIPEGRMLGSFDVPPYGGLVTMQETMIRYYAHPAAAVPEDSLVWGDLTRAVGRTGIIRRDESGEYRLFYVVSTTTKVYDYTNFKLSEYADTLHKVLIDGLGRAVGWNAVQLGKGRWIYDNMYGEERFSERTLKAVSVNPSCWRSILSVVFEWSSYSRTSSTVYEDEIIKIIASRTDVDTTSLVENAGCLDAPPNDIHRINTLDVSTVAVTVNDAIVNLTADVTTTTLSIPERSPVLLLRDGAFYLTVDNGHPSTPFHTYRVESFDTSGVVSPASLSAPVNVYACESPSGRTSYRGYDENGVKSLVVGNNFAVVGSSRMRRDSWTTVDHPNDYRYFANAFTAYVATAGEWAAAGKDFYEHRCSEWLDEGRSFINGTGWDPNTSDLLIQYTGGSNRTIGKFDVNGTQLWTCRQPNSYYEDYRVSELDLIADTGQSYIIADANTLHWFYGETKLRTERLDSLPGNSEYLRLYGDRFLRYSLVDSVTVRLQTYSMKGRLLGFTSLHLPETAASFFITQSRHDSVLACIWSDDGIHAAFVTQDLFVLEEDVRISDTRSGAVSPTGVFRNDTLFVVWADGRNGASDIYCNMVVSPPVPASPGRVRFPTLPSHTVGGARVATHEVRSASGRSSAPVPEMLPTAPLLWEKFGRIELFPIPNPTAGTTYVRFILRQESDVTIRLYDELGRTVRRYTEESLGTGTQWIPLDLRDVRPGVYTVVLTAGEAVGVGRIVRRP